MLLEAFQSVSATDREPTAAALGKLVRGERLSRQDRQVLKRLERSWLDSFRQAVYGQISLRDFQRLSGRSASQLRQQGERYGLPFSKSPVDLRELLPALFDFLAKNARRLRGPAPDGDELLMSGGPDDAALRRYRNAKAALAEVQLGEKLNHLVPIEDVRRLHAAWECGIRAAQKLVIGDREMEDLFFDALELADRETKQFLKDHPRGEWPEEGSDDAEVSER